MAAISVALQLYTVRDDAAADFEGTLKQVAQIGYSGVELAGTYGKTADELSNTLQGFALRIAGASVRPSCSLRTTRTV